MSFAAVALPLVLALHAAAPRPVPPRSTVLRVTRPAVAPPNAPSSAADAGAKGPSAQLDRAYLAGQLKQELVHLTFLNGAVGLQRGTHEESLGHWGQHAPGLLGGSPAAHAQATSFHHYRLASRLFGYAALASYLADLGYLIYSGSTQRLDRRSAGVAYGLLGGGIVLSVVSSTLQNVAFNRLGRAVVLENESVVDRVVAPPAQARLSVSPLPGGLAAGAELSF